MQGIQHAGKILIIDDEPGILKMLRLLLRALDYEVFTASGGEEGLEIFRKEEPPIVLTDVRMPGMNGIEVLKRLKGINPDVQVVVVTGHGEMETAIQALQLEASDFITKPVQGQALEVALKRANERIRMKRQIQNYTRQLETIVDEATEELAQSCRRLETFYEISQRVGEMSSLGQIVDFLRQEITSITQFGCSAILILDDPREALIPYPLIQGRQAFAEDVMAAVKELSHWRALNADEEKRFRAKLSVPAGRLVLVPIAREGEPPVGAAVITIPPEASEDELRLVSLLLSQAVGAIGRAVVQEEELKTLRRIVGVQEHFGDLIGRHEKMRQIYKLIANVAESDATVLILGESGTGKELVARRIHELSSRKDGAFITINCAAYPESLIESELFGHEKGSFTGATHTRKGCFELASGGTIFLDEIGEVSPAAQVKLLRVLQFKEFQRVGGEASIKVDVRVLAATSRNLRREMELGTFREDLFYRLHVIPVIIPPLRERISDLQPLVEHFIQKFSEQSNKKILDVMPDVLSILMNHRWPGNVRELENVVEHAVILARGDAIQVADLPAYLRENGRQIPSTGDGLEEMEKQHLIRVLGECQGNKIQAARRLKISRSTLYRKMELYGIQD